jgi:beta propeller repeat protein
VSGDRVVWAELRSGNPDVFMYDFAVGIETRITDDPASQTLPDVSGDIVVWMDLRNDPGDQSNTDIFLFDIATGLEGEVTVAPGRQSAPRIDGDRIVWNDQRDGGYLVLFEMR